ncbi:MAG: class I tRNA ligase family protein, partial [Microgenomates group bacterium]
DEFSTWYIRRSRDRVGPAAESKKDREVFYNTTYYVLTTICKVMAPFIPFVTDIIYKNLTREESIHLTDWPVSNKELSPEELMTLNEMQAVREIVEKVHSIRKEKVIPVRQPLSSAKAGHPISQIRSDILKIACEELNVKSLKVNEAKELTATLDTKITKELEEEAKGRDLARKIQEERKNMSLNLTQKVNVFSDWIPSDKKVVQWLSRKAQIKVLKLGKFKVVKAS